VWLRKTRSRAKQRGVAFCEATEVYSGFEGNLN